MVLDLTKSTRYYNFYQDLPIERTSTPYTNDTVFYVKVSQPGASISNKQAV